MSDSGRPSTEPAVVALGGGHGLASSLTALRRLTGRITAVVTVADDGGSSGRLRAELAALPPGDLRMALAALAGDDPWSDMWARLFQHRFPGDGPLGSHAVGNLVLTALAQVTGSMVDALEVCGRLLGARGRVLPLTTADVDLVAEVAGLHPGQPGEVAEVRGQVAVATTPGRVCGARLDPTDPPGCPESVQAVLEADWVVLGPGSLFTSVIPHLLVPEMRAALTKTEARRVFVLNLAPQAGETTGFSAEGYLEALSAHAPELRLDHVLADSSVADRPGLEAAAATLGAQVQVAAVAADDGRPEHDPDRLAAAYRWLMMPADPASGGDARAWR